MNAPAPPLPVESRLILASASPRRRELIALFGLPFDVVPSRYEEPPAPAYPIALADFVRELAENKAREVALRPEYEGALVVGADTLVTLGGLEQTAGQEIPLGKPTDEEHAKAMLRQLSGRTHHVVTGVALLRIVAGEIMTRQVQAVRTGVRFRALSEPMIADYVATGEPMDKAGAYGAQGYAAPFIEGFEGDFFNVVGLPLCALGQMLEAAGILWWQARAILPPLIG